MGTCNFCGKESELISSVLKICRKCILEKDWKKVHEHLKLVHANVRKKANLPSFPPKTTDANLKYKCNLCLNNCSLSEKDVSYCGLRNMIKNQDDSLPFPTKSIGYMHGYLDRNPTNCCNAWFCPAGTERGYPEYSDFNGPEYGTYSYAAFLYGCTFNCLFCQNASHKFFSRINMISVDDVAERIFKNPKITCICYFGGTPEAQLPFTINLSQKIIDKISREGQNRKFRVCWEWNGTGDPKLVEKCMEIAIKTGGNIKFDLKTFNERLNIALCGVSNSRTLSNFEFLAKKFFNLRRDPPVLGATTLLVSGYVNHKEVELISKFISSINPDIPYSLLVFHPDYQMKDLPITPKNEALKCLSVAKKYLKNVNLGNKFLLNIF